MESGKETVLNEAIARSTEGDQHFLLATAWTFSQLPPVKNQTDCDFYGNMGDDILARARDTGEDLASLTFMRSASGILATCLGMRCLEWDREDRQR